MSINWERVKGDVEAVFQLVITVIGVAYCLMLAGVLGCSAPNQSAVGDGVVQKQQAGALNAYAEKLGSLLDAVVETNAAVGGIVTQMGDQNFDPFTIRALTVGILVLMGLGQGASIWEHRKYHRRKRTDVEERSRAPPDAPGESCPDGDR